MKNRSKVVSAALVASAMLFATMSVPSFGFIIGGFPGMDKFIEQSDTIVIVQIEKQVDDVDREGHMGTTTYLCRVQKTMKGELAAGSTLPLHLVDASPTYRRKFVHGSTHILFLEQMPKNKDDPEYLSPGVVGNNIEIAPRFNQKKLTGKTIKENIKLLIEDYIEFRNEDAKRENEFLNKVLEAS